MFYENHTTLEIIAQLMVATLFVGTLAINATTKVRQHADRMAAMGVPMPMVSLWAGFVLQAVGGVMVTLDWHTNIGAIILIVFTLLASAIFHRFWTMDDPLRRHMHLSILFSNVAVVGALLLLMRFPL
ncbi:MAG: DoxX family protein [Alphaproteobacteria bacterium]|jgi:putative oxidoreductase|nr:DoxX family protein [Alphaproteobacteria bacterium]